MAKEPEVWKTRGNFGNVRAASQVFFKATEEGLLERRKNSKGWTRNAASYEYLLTEAGRQFVASLPDEKEEQ